MKNKRSSIGLVMLITVVTLVVVGFFYKGNMSNAIMSSGIKSKGSILLATTTSTENSGLLDFLLPYFEEETGTKVKVIAVGTGKALQMGEDGEVDVLLVHAKESEEIFINEGHGTQRFDVMYNDFVLIGPQNDEVNLMENNSNIVEALKTLSEGSYTFISRGDDSGTHKKELQLWNEAGIDPAGAWYLSAGKGMGDTIQMTNEKLGYTLTDRATYLSMMNNLELKIILEGDERLFNQYGVIPVNPDKNEMINNDGANLFVEWILSEKTQTLIGEFGVEEFLQPLFIPNGE